MKKVVVLGGGYGGYKIISKLVEKNIPEDVQILLIDRTPFHTMKTEFYALAAGTVSDKEVRMEFPEHKQITFVCDVVTRINLEEKTVLLGHSGKLTYDYLVIGLGCEDKYYDIKGAREFAYSVQSIENSRKTFEAVQNARPYGQITIVGAGLTGVELASEIRESRKDLKIRLLDKGSTILPALPKKLQEHVAEWLVEHDIEIIHNSHVEYIENGAVSNTGMCLLTDVTIWAGGIKPNSVIEPLEVKKDRYGRIVLNEFHQIPNFENAFVVGDCASLPHAPSAQLAKAQGKQIVEVLADLVNDRDPKPLPEMKIKGSLGSLGKHEGFGTAFGLSLSGSLARLMKSGVLWMHKFNK